MEELILFFFSLYSHFFFIFYFLKHCAFLITQLPKCSHVSIQHFDQLKILHILQWLISLILDLLLYVKVLLSFCDGHVLQSLLLLLLQSELLNKLLPGFVSFRHHPLMLHLHEVFSHLIRCLTHWSLVELMEQPVDIHLLESRLYLWVLFFTNDSFLLLLGSLCLLHANVHFVSEFETLVSHLLCFCLVLLAISHLVDLLLPVIVFSLVLILQNIICFVNLLEVVCIDACVYVGMILTSSTEICLLKLFVICCWNYLKQLIKVHLSIVKLLLFFLLRCSCC